ncbi:MAG TPA: glycosyltransferase [Pyrinomonadaceae bacterium]
MKDTGGRFGSGPAGEVGDERPRRREIDPGRPAHQEELPRETPGEIDRLRAEHESTVAAHERLKSELEEIKASFGFKLLTRVLWPLWRRLLPGLLRAYVKSALLRLRSGRRGRAASAGGEAGELRWGIDADLSEPFAVGRGNLFHLSGWCYHPRKRIKKLSVLVDGAAHHVVNHSLATPDVFAEQSAGGEDRAGLSLTSGFWTALPFAEIDEPRQVALSLRAVLADGSESEAQLGTLNLIAREPDERPADLAAATGPAPGEPFVVICLTTYNPPLDLFARQIESIAGQTHRNWLCIVSDDHSDPATFEEVERIAAQDARFRVLRNPARLGFYRNFERCLRLAPASADFIALSDQDDQWYEDKLASCLAEFRADDVQMVYSDMDIVTREGETLSCTYWTTRRNNYTDLETLLLANTVTGAAIVFRSGLLPDLLPFPRMNVGLYHDNWIACVALTKGRIGYVDRPLYAYRQHQGNVIGHCIPAPITFRKEFLSIAYLLKLFLRGATDFGHYLTPVYRSYYDMPVRVSLLAGVLGLRFGGAAARRRALLKRMRRLPFSLPELVRQVIRYKLVGHQALGREWFNLRVVIAVRLFKLYYHSNRAYLAGATPGQPTPAAPPELDAGASADFAAQKIAPLRLRVSPPAGRRVNLLVHAVDFRYVFAGYLSVYQLALQLKRAGYAVRLVIIDECDYRPSEWPRQSADYDTLRELFADVESAYVFDRAAELEVSAHDRFIAIGWWMAHVAHRAARDLGQEKFIYLIQEYDPLIFPAGSYHALAAQAYTFPHHAIFSTATLADYFREHRIGVYANGEAAPVVIENAVRAFDISEDGLRARARRRLLFYTRPEPQNERNMFELGVLALRAAIGEGHFGGRQWEFHGMGAINKFKSVPLGGGARLEMLPKLTLEDYRRVLPTYDLGLSLMLTPHPSMVPLDMAAAGLVAVTNTFATKTAERMAAISPNIIAAPPTIDGIKLGLVEALGAVDDAARRVAGARLNWATSWEETFNPEVMAAVRRFIGW